MGDNSQHDLPKDRLNKIIENSLKKLNCFEGHHCFNYLNDFQQHILKLQQASSVNEINIEFRESKKSLFYFEICSNEKQFNNKFNV